MFAFVVFSALVALGSTQYTAHPDPLHNICHNNTEQLMEDQVIENVVRAMDVNDDGDVEALEVLVFFVDLLDVDLGSYLLHTVGGLDVDELRNIGADVIITRSDFVNAWHARFHDSVEFVEATFDRFDVDKNGRMDFREMEEIVIFAIFEHDTNSDGSLENSELVAFLERIYHNC